MQSLHGAVGEILTVHTLVWSYTLSHNLSFELRASWQIRSIWIIEKFRYIFCLLSQMDQQIYLGQYFQDSVIDFFFHFTVSFWLRDEEVWSLIMCAFLLYMAVNCFLKHLVCCLLHSPLTAIQTQVNDT